MEKKIQPLYFIKDISFLRKDIKTISLEVAKQWTEKWKEILTYEERRMNNGSSPIVVKMFAVYEDNIVRIMDNISHIYLDGNPKVVTTNGSSFEIVDTGVTRCQKISTFLFNLVDDDKNVSTQDFYLAKEWYNSGRKNLSIEIGKFKYPVEGFYMNYYNKAIKADGRIYVFH